MSIHGPGYLACLCLPFSQVAYPKELTTRTNLGTPEFLSGHMSSVEEVAGTSRMAFSYRSDSPAFSFAVSLLASWADALHGSP